MFSHGRHVVKTGNTAKSCTATGSTCRIWKAVAASGSKQSIRVQGRNPFVLSFVTWQEDPGVTGEGYHVYRATSPITSANIGQAQKLTAKWGALDDNTSRHALTGVGAPANFVIQDQGTALTDDQGVFVYTIPGGEAGNWYYAVTEVIGGYENQALTAGSNSLSSPVNDTVAKPLPVLISTINSGKGRVYTQFMDYRNWNPTFEGYAYNYSVALPTNYDPGVA